MKIPFTDRQHNEIANARRKHTTPVHSAHEGYAIIMEEVCEFWDEVKEKKIDEDMAVCELIQIAAMAQRTAEDVFGQ